MPTLDVNQVHTLETKHYFISNPCCAKWTEFWSSSMVGYKNGKVKYLGAPVEYCPFCGERVVVLVTEKPPSGYIKIQGGG
jgi:hypothetical protein